MHNQTLSIVSVCINNEHCPAPRDPRLQRSPNSNRLCLCAGRLPMFTEPRHVFAHYKASFYKRACSSVFWIEHTNIGRKCCQKSTKICYSIIFECCLAHRFRSERPAAIGCCCTAIL